MNVEIINVGTELLLGEIVNTNATYLQQMCKQLGFDVYYTTIVGDNPERLKDTLKIAFDRGADCVITTGGLGPTQDDLTKEFSAEYLDLPLIFNQKEYDKVYQKVLHIFGVVTQSNKKQAYFPKDAYILENPVGTANGCVMKNNHKMIINLPGPPKELKYIVDHSLINYLSQFKQEQIFTDEILVVGIGESQVEDIVKDIESNQTDITIALYCGEGQVRIRLGCKDYHYNHAIERMFQTKEQIINRLNEYVIKSGDIRNELSDIMKPICITGDYKISDYFKQYLDEKASMQLHSQIKHGELGDSLTFTLNDKQFTINTLGDYQQSYARIERWLMMNIYLYLKTQ